MRLNVGDFYRIKMSFAKWSDRKHTDTYLFQNDIIFVLKLKMIEDSILQIDVIDQHIKKFYFEIHNQNITLFFSYGLTPC